MPSFRNILRAVTEISELLSRNRRYNLSCGLTVGENSYIYSGANISRTRSLIDMRFSQDGSWDFPLSFSNDIIMHNYSQFMHNYANTTKKCCFWHKLILQKLFQIFPRPEIFRNGSSHYYLPFLKFWRKSIVKKFTKKISKY